MTLASGRGDERAQEVLRRIVSIAVGAQQFHELPEDLGIRRTDATRSLLAAGSVADLVEWSDGLYNPPAKFRSW